MASAQKRAQLEEVGRVLKRVGEESQHYAGFAKKLELADAVRPTFLLFMQAKFRNSKEILSCCRQHLL